jgi:Uma2 family endonuclease
MNAPFLKPWTQAQFFAWAAHQEGRWEFDGFRPVAMTGGTANHNLIGQNVIAALRDTGCRPFGSDVGVETTGGAVRYPDAFVSCSKFEGDALTIPGAVVVFEVVSPTSGRIDRIVKVREYATVPSIRRYVILEFTSMDLLVFERTHADEAWTARALTADETLHMPEIGSEIPVAEFYEEVDLGGDPAAETTAS